MHESVDSHSEIEGLWYNLTAIWKMWTKHLLLIERNVILVYECARACVWCLALSIGCLGNSSIIPQPIHPPSVSLFLKVQSVLGTAPVPWVLLFSSCAKLSITSDSSRRKWRITSALCHCCQFSFWIYYRLTLIKLICTHWSGYNFSASIRLTGLNLGVWSLIWIETL